MQDHWTVGRVAELGGVSVRTLHHYDEIGLVCPSPRTSAGYRAYSAGDVERLREVLAYRRLGFGLREVAELSATRRPTRSRTCADCGACFWNGVIALTPWWRPSTENLRPGRRDSW
jgi:DNA-binding transcriptional MerR regulator